VKADGTTAAEAAIVVMVIEDAMAAGGAVIAAEVKIPVTMGIGSAAREGIPQAGKAGAVPVMADHGMAVPVKAVGVAATGMKTAGPGMKDNTTKEMPPAPGMYHSSPLTNGWPITSRSTKRMEAREPDSNRTRGPVTKRPMTRGPAEKPDLWEESPIPVTIGKNGKAVLARATTGRAEVVQTAAIGKAGMTGSGRADRTGGPETALDSSVPDSRAEHHGDRAHLRSRHRQSNRRRKSPAKKGYCPASWAFSKRIRF
jgi:hypothetical protein